MTMITFGMDQMIFSTAYYTIADFNKVAEFLKNLHNKKLFFLDEFDGEIGRIDGAFLRSYPKNHWNPLAKSPTARQVVGSASIHDGVFKLETMTKNRLKEARQFIEAALKEAIRFEKEEFVNPLEINLSHKLQTGMTLTEVYRIGHGKIKQKRKIL